MIYRILFTKRGICKMEEKLTMDDYATELEASLRKVQEGDVQIGRASCRERV